MEIKATLNKPYSETARLDFIVENNHKKGYEIRETLVALEAWGETDEEKLAKAKEAKFKEASEKAFEYLEGGEALFEFEEGKSIEATDGNIAKLGLALVNFLMHEDYESTIDWNTKENENIQLNASQLQVIVAGLQGIQADVWTLEFPMYNQQIEEAQTLADVEAIEIDYGTVGELQGAEEVEEPAGEE